VNHRPSQDSSIQSAEKYDYFARQGSRRCCERDDNKRHFTRNLARKRGENTLQRKSVCGVALSFAQGREAETRVIVVMDFFPIYHTVRHSQKRVAPVESGVQRF
jgi:hypothetical protein